MLEMSGTFLCCGFGLYIIVLFILALKPGYIKPRQRTPWEEHMRQVRAYYRKNRN